MKKVFYILLILIIASCQKQVTNYCGNPESCNGTSCDQEAVKDDIEQQEPPQYRKVFNIAIWSDKDTMNLYNLIRVLNHSFEGVAYFQIDSHVQADLNDIDWYLEDTRRQESLVYQEGKLNLYLTDTKTNLLGFVLMPPTDFKRLEQKVFNQAFVADNVPFWEYTVAHELAHLFSLGHEFELPRNIMSYSQCGHLFEPWQKRQMVLFNEKNRGHN